MTAAQRATLEGLLAEYRGMGDCADALRAALGTCGTCAHAGEETDAGLIWCAAPMRTLNDVKAYPFSYRLMPLGERCTGWTPNEGA